MHSITLNKLDWQFKAANDESWLPAVVPGCVHTDLLRNNQIPDPFYGTNELKVQWIDKQDWEYRAVFDVPGSVMAERRIELVFDGLDTYADVLLNGEHVLSADNMFRTWRADAKPYLQLKDNVLLVRFRSPIHEDAPKLEKLGFGYPAPNDHSEDGGVGDKKLSVFARKAPYHYGWDWGPRFVTSGIWRGVRLEAWSGARIHDLYIRQDEITAERAGLTAVVEIESETEHSGTLTVETEGSTWTRDVKLAPGRQTVELQAVIDRPKLWWSRGLGEQHRYAFRASFQGSGGSVAERTAVTGLRSVKVVRNKEGEGTTFRFELNGVPVFAKGANHIPNDSFPTETTIERYRHEIASAAESNMNMLRVWGGGIYENDEFYDLCDEYGIMVWQDFMFACSMYPGDEAFLENVRREAADNIVRLRNHPCIALWCGNNEIDSAWAEYNEEAGWGWKQQYTPEQRKKLWADYEAVFHRILPEEVSRLAPDVDYWPSSPMAALTGDITQHATDITPHGDIHYWGVWHASEPFENYAVKVGRFMSEYGFQSFPEEKTVRLYAEEADMALESEVMLSHQKNNRGNLLIKEYMDLYMKEPKDFPSFLYMSQVLQAEAMKTAIEAHRRNKPYCMGSLYWQMNDCWPVASWASMDYYGRWKAVQYYAKSSFQDVMLSIDGSKEGRIGFHVVTDELVPFEGMLEVRAMDFAGNVLTSHTEAVRTAANSAQEAWSASTESLLAGRPAERVVIVGKLLRNGAIVDEKTHYAVPFKQLELPRPVIALKEDAAGDGSRWILETNALAKQVWLSSEVEGIFGDNYFDLIPGEPKVVEFFAPYGEEKAFAPASPGHITIRSMTDFIKS